MEQRLCESTERGSQLGNTDRGLHEVEYRIVNPYKGVVQLAPLVWEYWNAVNQEDLSEWEDVEIHPGIVAPYQKVEMKIYTLERKGMEFMGAFIGDEMVGFMVHRLAYDVILLIDHFFVLPEYEGMGIGKGMVHALPNRVKKVYFWTRKKNPPKLLGVLKDSVKLFEDENHITWEMTWVAKPE